MSTYNIGTGDSMDSRPSEQNTFTYHYVLCVLLLLPSCHKVVWG